MDTLQHFISGAGEETVPHGLQAEATWPADLCLGHSAGEGQGRLWLPCAS